MTGLKASHHFADQDRLGTSREPESTAHPSMGGDNPCMDPQFSPLEVASSSERLGRSSARLCCHVRGLLKGLGEMGAAYPNLTGKNLWTKTIEGAGVPLHAGTIKFLREKGVTIRPDLLPPEAK